SNVLFCGDFNSRHPAWDSLCVPNLHGSLLFNFIQNNNLCIFNNPSVSTFSRTYFDQNSVPHSSSSSPDLVFGSSILPVHNWHLLTPLHQQDHFPILFSISFGISSPCASFSFVNRIKYLNSIR